VPHQAHSLPPFKTTTGAGFLKAINSHRTFNHGVEGSRVRGFEGSSPSALANEVK
jgi:hypothetical protein